MSYLGFSFFIYSSFIITIYQYIQLLLVI